MLFFKQVGKKLEELSVGVHQVVSGLAVAVQDLTKHLSTSLCSFFSAGGKGGMAFTAIKIIEKLIKGCYILLM